MSSFLDGVIAGVQQILHSGTAKPKRPKLNFTSGFSVTDNPATDSLDVTSVGSDTLAESDLASLRAVVPADEEVAHVLSPLSTWFYSASQGAGVVDDGFSVVRPNGVLVGSPGRWYNVNNSTVLPTRAALRLAIGQQATVHEQSYSTIGDGGGGIWDWQPGNGDTDNDGTIVKPTALGGGNTGRWKRRYSGPIHLEWFGLVHDSDAAVATNTARFNAVMAAFKIAGSPRFSAGPGEWRFNNQLLIDQMAGMHLIGAGRGSTYFVYKGTFATDRGNSFTFTANLATNFLTSVAHALPNGAQVHLTTTGALPTGLVVGTRYYVVNRTNDTFQLAATSGGAAIDLTGSQSGTHTCFQYTTDFVLMRASASCVIEGISFYCPPVSGSYTALNAFRMTSEGSLYAGCQYNTLRNCAFQGSYNGLYIGSVDGGDVNLDSNRFENCSSIFNDGSGYVISDFNTAHSIFVKCQSSDNGVNGFLLRQFPIASHFKSCQVSGNADADYHVENTFSDAITITGFKRELQNDGVFLVVDPTSGGVSPFGSILIEDCVFSNNNDAGVKIIQYQGSGRLELNRVSFSGHNGTGEIFVEPSTGANTYGERLLITRGITLATGAAFNVTLSGNNPMRWLREPETTTNNLGDVGWGMTDLELHGGARIVAQGRAVIPAITGVTAVQSGVNGQDYVIDVDKSAFITNATTSTCDFFNVPEQTRVLHVISDVTQLFAGVAGVTSAKIGNTAPNDDDAYILSHDVKTGPLPVRRGLISGAGTVADAGQGVQLDAATAVPGGWIPRWAGDGTTSIRCTITSASGAIGTGSATNFSTGKIRFYVRLAPMI